MSQNLSGDARPLTANSTKFSCNARPDHTFGSFSTEAANSAARPRSASPQKLTSGADEKLVAMGQSRRK
jgi:hypothetical protein